MRYRNYTLTLSPPDLAVYPLRVEADGAASLTLVLPPASPELIDAVGSMGVDPAALRDAGAAMFRWLFPSSVDAHFRAQWEAAERAGTGLRVRLALRAPEVAAWPWELLHDPVRSHTFASAPATPLVRYFDAARTALPPPATPLALLLVLPKAADLDIEAERRNVQAACAALGGLLSVRVLDGIVTRADLADALLMGDYAILHFGGHGGYAVTARGGRGYLALNRPDGDEDWLDDATLARLAGSFSSLRLVVLNSCNSAAEGDYGSGSEGQGFAGVAPHLLAAGVPAVVAMQRSIGDAPASTFAREFYKRLTLPGDAGQVDAAVTHARSMLALLHAGGSWATPVLYTASEDCRIFAPAPERAPDRDRLAALTASLNRSAGAEEDWVLAEVDQLYIWRGQLLEAAEAYRSHLATSSGEVAEAAHTGLALIESRLRALERALMQYPGYLEHEAAA